MTVRREYAGIQVAPFTRQIAGVLSADGDKVVLFCQNAASALVTLDGTFDGEVTVTGSVEDPTDDDVVEGGRLLFQSGVGSVGDNTVRSPSGLLQREYRVVCGGNYLIVRARNWVSGQVSVQIHAQQGANISFLNGPAHTTFEEAQRAGRAFSVGTGTVSVTAASFLQARLSNPVDNPGTAFIVLRLFSNNITGSSPEISFYPTYSTPLLGATQVTPNNLRPGRPPSNVEFEFRTAMLPLGLPPLQQILPRAEPYQITITRIVPPGQSFAYEIGGAGGGVNSAARVAMSFAWFEEGF